MPDKQKSCSNCQHNPVCEEMLKMERLVKDSRLHYQKGTPLHPYVLSATKIIYARFCSCYLNLKKGQPVKTAPSEEGDEK